MRLTGRLVRITDLTGAERDEMFSLMRGFYDNVERSTFEIDLQEKHWVILLQDPADQIVRGFSTQMLLRLSVGGRRVRALFSGDTIVHSNYWAQNPLAQIWGRLALCLMTNPDDDPLYWFLTTKGYKTYRFLPVFFHEFFPRHDAVTPCWAMELIDAFAALKYPDSYQLGSGIMSWGERGCRLGEGVAAVTHHRLRDPHVQMFVHKNPDHARGDELCCIAPLTRNNFTNAAWRVIGSKSSLADAVT